MGVYQLRILEFPENVILQQSANLLRKGVLKLCTCALCVCPVCVLYAVLTDWCSGGITDRLTGQ